MRYALLNASVYINGSFEKKNVFIENGKVSEISEKAAPQGCVLFDFNNCFIFPGFVDVHVHLREPGFLYKETIKTGTEAAAHGGFCAVCAMPNLSPVPDTIEHLKIQTEAIEKSARIAVYPYGAITVGEQGERLSEMESLAENVVAFSDDGRGVQNDEMMKEAMKKAAKLKKIIAAHCEDNSLLFGGYINDGEYARKNGHKGICSKSEWKPIERDIRLAEETGAAYHVCHISTRESVELIRAAKANGIDVTCETAPHYLTLCDEDLKNDGRFKMNPPLRSKKDKEALIEGVLDGTIDMLATDHAPHSAEEKSKGLKDSLMGIVGLETAFPVMYTEFVRTGIMPIETLISLMSDKPAERFEIKTGIKVGETANLTVFDLNAKYKIDPREFYSMGKATPFEGKEVYGKCLLTVADGNIAYGDKIK